MARKKEAKKNILHPQRVQLSLQIGGYPYDGGQSSRVHVSSNGNARHRKRNHSNLVIYLET